MVTIVLKQPSKRLSPVLSPPCGMATNENEFDTYNMGLRSKPTAWDGDALESWIVSVQILYSGSKPTVWDGDLNSP